MSEYTDRLKRDNADLIARSHARADRGTLTAVMVNGKGHHALIAEGFLCHHLDGQAVYLERRARATT